MARDIDEATARLEVWSEFSEAPEPQKSVRSVLLWGDPAGPVSQTIRAEDETLDFQSMTLIPGRAYRASEVARVERSKASSAPVVKRWQRGKDGAALLVESVDLASIRPAFVDPRTDGWVPGIILDYQLQVSTLMNVNFGPNEYTGAAAL